MLKMQTLMMYLSAVDVDNDGGGVYDIDDTDGKDHTMAMAMIK